MLPFLIPMAARNLPWRLIGIGVAVVTCLAAGIWFRGVLADRDKLAAQMEITMQELANLSGEIDRMEKQDAADFALRENIEAAKKLLAKELAANQQRLERAKGLLNEIERKCLDMHLPDSYLRMLPQNPAKVHQGEDAATP